ncbi:MAG: spermidine/putrescine transport system substrate-binding protein, partial [Kribbellaceae bacterium]|nr:spermidine/putrescine transport system substrate-binding protein [Kribbellaceae bacterium]
MSPRPQPVIGRRTVLRGAALGLGAAGLLNGCGIPAAKQSAGSCVSTDKSAAEKALIFSNWPSY